MKIMSSKTRLWFCVCLILTFLQNIHGYRKYYIEDECLPSIKKQKITLRLPATGPDSVGEIRSNRFGTYSRTERNCVLKLNPPKGYGIILTILKIDFRNRENCKDFIKIITSDDEDEELCGCQELGVANQTFFSDGDVRIIYHTSDGVIITSDDEDEKLCGYQELGVANQTFFSDSDVRIIYHTSEGGMGFNKGIHAIFTVSKSEDGCSDSNSFKCRNSHCIWAGVTCDGINNCGDSSDENFSDYPYCPEITPLAITAVVLAIISFITIVAAICMCCCRSQPKKEEKPYLFRDFHAAPNGGYAPLPGYNYGSAGYTPRSMQPEICSSVHPSAPIFNPNGYSYSTVPLVQQKVEIRYDRPPPYDA